MTDDGLYTISPILREVLPRGLHSITAQVSSRPSVIISLNVVFGGFKVILLLQPKTAGVQPSQLWFRGIYKFTGLSANDEDEASNSHDANFFHGGRTLTDAAHLFVTR